MRERREDASTSEPYAELVARVSSGLRMASKAAAPLAQCRVRSRGA